MAVLQMQRVSICALKKDRKSILEKVQNMGIMEVSQITDGLENYEKMDTANARQGFDKKAQLADQALDVLNTFVPEKRSLLSSLEGKKLVENDRMKQAEAKKDAIMDTASLLVLRNKEIAESKANILKLENQIESLTPWLSLEVPMTYTGTKKTSMLIGTMAGGTTLQTVCDAIAERAPEAEAYDVQIIAAEKDATYLVVVCLREIESQLEEALRASGFAKPSQMTEKVPAEVKKELLAEIEKLNTRIVEITKEIESYADSREDLKLVSDYYRIRADKYEVLGTIPQSQRTFIISGYVAKPFVSMIEKSIGDKFDCVVDVEEIKEDEEPPVILKNNPVSESVEGVLTSYGLPRKGEFDPTTIMSFFYIFFFGMMLSDAGYGAIVSIACFAALKKFPRMSPGMRKSLKMFMYCGISTIVWGILFSGYFGDAVDTVTGLLTGTRVTVPALWFVPLNDPMRLLVYSLAFGVIHLFVGHGIKGYVLIKEGKVFDAICDVGLWYAFLIGLMLMLLPTDIFASIAQTQIVFPPAVNALAKGLAIVGAVGLLLMSGRANKNPALRIALGAYDLYNITGWLSDVLSYSRLLALGLATGVIASVINQMGSMLGIIGFIPVFIIGHTLNLAINLLGAYVHTNRLQFVEFFGKFYEGGGKAFEPFKADTKYVDIKEETL